MQKQEKGMMTKQGPRVKQAPVRLWKEVMMLMDDVRTESLRLLLSSHQSLVQQRQIFSVILCRCV